jgi:cytochrome P450
MTLKSGTFVFMPNVSVHFDANSWGSNVDHFDGKRFTKMGTKVPRGAFVGFGGGKNMCPGRYFAMNQILSLVAMLVLRFDISPMDGQTWQHPGVDDHDTTINIRPPKTRLW